MSAREFDVYDEGPVVQGSVLPPGSEFEGVLSFRGQATIEGRLYGTVIAEGLLRIEAGGLRGRVEVDELIVGGEVEGKSAYGADSNCCRAHGCARSPRAKTSSGRRLGARRPLYGRPEHSNAPEGRRGVLISEPSMQPWAPLCAARLRLTRRAARTMT